MGDSVPRSQLMHTLTIVLSNHRKMIADVIKKCSEPVRRFFEESLRPPNPQPDEDGGEDDEEIAERLIPGKDDVFSKLLKCWCGKNSSQGDQADDVKNKVIVRHEHITQHKFRLRSRDFIRKLEKSAQPADKGRNFIIDFEDSDNEDDGQERHADAPRRQADSAPPNPEMLSVLADARRDVLQEDDDTAEVEETYEELDRVRDGAGVHTGGNTRYSLFPAPWGYGRPSYSPCCVLSLLDETTPVYFWQIDSRRLKMTYTDAEGLPIAFVFHKKLLERSLKSCRIVLEKSAEEDSARGDKKLSVEDSLLAYREKLLKWLTDLVRSPLPKAVINWFLDKLQNGLTVHMAPKIMHLDLSVIAHCVAMSLPTPNDCRSLFARAFVGDIPKGFVRFCKRKNELYGIHIVKGGTLSELEKFGAGVQTCMLGYDALTQSKDNASMYLEIIGKFSALTWIVYVTGLDKIDDALLKWLAEYTKEHPWRFVYLENTQTSWNFSENRDRCVQDFAPPPIERDLAYKDDLSQPSVSQLRPNHQQMYPRIKDTPNLNETAVLSMDWDQMAAATAAFFFQDSGSTQATDAAGTLSTPINAWHAFNKTVAVDENFQDHCTTIFDQDDPCLVLLCSPPGHARTVTMHAWTPYACRHSCLCAPCHLPAPSLLTLHPAHLMLCTCHKRRSWQIAFCRGAEAQDGGQEPAAVLHRRQ
jgi:hypothetical protein